MAPPAPATSLRFLDLAQEIRNQIYCELLCDFEPQPTIISAYADADSAPLKEDRVVSTQSIPSTGALSIFDAFRQFNFGIKCYSPRPPSFFLDGGTIHNPTPSLANHNATVNDPSFLNGVRVAKHAIDTSILLVSKQVHREAYDVMVKMHRFVRVNTSWGSYIRGRLKKRCITIVTEDKKRIDHFQGYVLSVSITSPKEVGPMYQNFPFFPNPSSEPSSLMLLGRDMDVFCDVLMDSNERVLNFGAKISLKIVVAPGKISVSASDFFTEKTQETLLKPFRHRLRGFTRTKVRGLVSCKIAKAPEVDITQDPAYDPEALLKEYELTNLHCQSLPRERNTKLACLAWQDASVEIERLHKGMSWKMLTDKGGASFVSRIAEMYFLMKLNVASIGIAAMQKGETFADFLVEDALAMATKSLRDGHWMLGFKFQPIDTQRAKLNYERALLFRLEGNPDNIGIAVVLIQTAHHWLPQDADIAKERDRIMVWKALMG